MPLPPLSTVHHTHRVDSPTEIQNRTSRQVSQGRTALLTMGSFEGCLSPGVRCQQKILLFKISGYVGVGVCGKSHMSL